MLLWQLLYNISRQEKCSLNSILIFLNKHTMSLLIRSFSILSVSFFCSLSVFVCQVATALDNFWIFPEMDLWYSLKSLACCRMLLRYSWGKKINTSYLKTSRTTERGVISYLNLGVSVWMLWKKSLPDVSACAFSPAQFFAVSPTSLSCGPPSASASCCACRLWSWGLSPKWCPYACKPLRPAGAGKNRSVVM